MSGKKEEIISKKKQEELDLILDAALDELDDDEDDDDSDSDNDSDHNDNEGEGKRDEDKCTNDVDQLKEVSNLVKERPVFGPQVPPTKHIPSSSKEVPASSEEAAIKDMMRHMEALFPSESTKSSSTRSNNINNDSGDKEEKKDKDVEKMNTKTKTSSKAKSQKSNSNQHEKMEENMAKLFEQLSQDIGDDTNGNHPDFDALDGDFMQEMAKEWESTMRGEEGQEEAVGQVVDGMMKQLLSKEFMYEPMKDICNQFPAWLAENKSKIDEKEYERYGKQYQYFQRIVHIYEYEPDNVARLSELMHDIQEFGQPPPELIKELAPDLEFDQNGIPKMDGAGLGPMMNQECCIM